VTNAATNGKSKFLADVPSEIRELLDWYEARAVPGSPGLKLTEFATKFLSGMVEDNAIIPPLAVSAPEVLALVLVTESCCYNTMGRLDAVG
jgi:hypothetical protein